MGQPAVNELPYPPAVEGSSYQDDQGGKPFRQIFRVTESSDEKRRPYTEKPSVDIDYDHSEKSSFSRPPPPPTQIPRYELSTKNYVRYQNDEDHPFIPKAVNPYAVASTGKPDPHQRPFRVTVKRPYDYHQKSVEPRGPPAYVQSYLEPIPKYYAPQRYESVVRLNEQPRLAVAEPTYRPYVVIEKPVTVTVRPHGEPVRSDYQRPSSQIEEDNGGFYPSGKTSYVARPYAQGIPQHYYHSGPADFRFTKEEEFWPVYSDPAPQHPATLPGRAQQFQRANRSLDSRPAPVQHVSKEQHFDGAVRGQPGRDYPVLEAIPDQINFDCNAVESPGYYADPETRCQVMCCYSSLLLSC